MTLIGHFALKSGSSCTSNRLAFWLSEKTARKFAELRIDCQRQQKIIPAAVYTGDSVMGYSWGLPKRKRQTSELYSHSQYTVLTHAVH